MTRERVSEIRGHFEVLDGIEEFPTSVRAGGIDHCETGRVHPSVGEKPCNPFLVGSGPPRSASTRREPQHGSLVIESYLA